MSFIETKKRNFWPIRILAGVGLVVVVLSMCIAEYRAQQNSREDLQDRFAVRAVSASTFITADVKGTLDKEQKIAQLRLGDENVTHDQFLTVTEDLGFGPSVLLDKDGYLLDVTPAKDDLLGVKMSEKYEYLQKAVNHEKNVSNVVPSAALGRPVVGFATPFETPHGTRVLSGAIDLKDQPLGNFLVNSLPYESSHVYLLDENNNIIVSSNSSEEKSILSLEQQDNGFEDVNLNHKKGEYISQTGEPSFYVSEKVDGTPWRVMMTVENDELYNPIQGTSKYLPYIFIACFIVVALFLTIILVRDRERRLKLQDVALIDLQTGIFNPRGIKSILTRVLSSSKRHENDLSIAIIDIDDFKKINDAHGHNVGDEVLNKISDQIQNRLRTEDILGRLGGEEFLVILPDTDTAGAKIVSERICHGVYEEVSVSNDENEKVTVSIGIATFTKDDTLESIVSRAEQALAQAKQDGKNQVFA